VNVPEKMHVDLSLKIIRRSKSCIPLGSVFLYQFSLKVNVHIQSTGKVCDCMRSGYRGGAMKFIRSQCASPQGRSYVSLPTCEEVIFQDCSLRYI
jgi:hypothetical protein